MSEPRHISELLKEVLRQLEGLQQSVEQIKKQSRRTDRILYRPSELSERLGISRTHAYALMNKGKLSYFEDERGRYCTEEQVQVYENRCNAVL